MTKLWTQDEAEGVYRYWATGRCPCCGVDEFDNHDDHEPAVIGEGVRICAFCAYRGHDEDDTAPVLLEMLLAGRR